MSEILRILDQMDRAFSGEAWHGPSLQELLEGISAEDASKHPVQNAHSVWELVNHITSWNMIVRRRLGGEDVEVTTEMDWPRVWETSEAEWKRSLEDLAGSRVHLREITKKLRDEQLGEKVEGGNDSIYVTLHGLIQHDLYHAGQIAVLKKALA